MSDHTWSHLPRAKRGKPKLSCVPDGFKIFLESKIKPVPTHDQCETDFMIRRALALWRLCWLDVPDGWELLNEKLSATLGETWLEAFEERNEEVVRY